MADFKLDGKPMQTVGELPAAGDKAPDFRLADKHGEVKSLADFSGRKKLLYIFPNINTPVCATSASEFDRHAQDNPDIEMLMVSVDLDFDVFCEGGGRANVTPLSISGDSSFATDYGVLVEQEPLTGRTARAVVAVDEQDKVIYSRLVPDVAQEPDYQEAIAAFR